MKWAEIFTGWFYYISVDSMEVFKDTLPIVCNGFKKGSFIVFFDYLII